METQTTEHPKMPDAQAPGYLSSYEEATNIFASLHQHVFTMHYKQRFEPLKSVFVAKNLKEARRLAEEYCKSWGLKIISITPFAIDIHSLRAEDVPTE